MQTPSPRNDDAIGLFSDSYAQARQRALQAAADAGARVQSHVLPLPGRDGEALAMDVILDGPDDAPNVLMTTSAVHGVEGHAGSAVQCGLLRRSAELRRIAGPHTALLHVHAVNPHGFSHGRRVNEDNVDLNRNFIDFTQPLPTHLDYDQIHHLLLPDTWPPGANNEAALHALTSTWDARRAQAAVTRGQFRHADGLFYGGQRPTWSHLRFRDVLREHVAGRRHLAWIDLHTGLGPTGVGERIFASRNDADTLARARRWWGQGLTQVENGSSTSIPLAGPIQHAVLDGLPGLRYTGICLEYGTVPPARMHAVLRADHWLHRHPEATPVLARAIRQDLRDAFYPDTPSWKHAVWTQALEATQQALQGLREDAEAGPAGP